MKHCKRIFSINFTIVLESRELSATKVFRMSNKFWINNSEQFRKKSERNREGYCWRFGILFLKCYSFILWTSVHFRIRIRAVHLLWRITPVLYSIFNCCIPRLFVWCCSCIYIYMCVLVQTPLPSNRAEVFLLRSASANLPPPPPTPPPQRHFTNKIIKYICAFLCLRHNHTSDKNAFGQKRFRTKTLSDKNAFGQKIRRAKLSKCLCDFTTFNCLLVLPLIPGFGIGDCSPQLYESWFIIFLRHLIKYNDPCTSLLTR